MFWNSGLRQTLKIETQIRLYKVPFGQMLPVVLLVPKLVICWVSSFELISSCVNEAVSQGDFHLEFSSSALRFIHTTAKLKEQFGHAILQVVLSQQLQISLPPRIQVQTGSNLIKMWVPREMIKVFSMKIEIAALSPSITSLIHLKLMKCHVKGHYTEYYEDKRKQNYPD